MADGADRTSERLALRAYEELLEVPASARDSRLAELGLSSSVRSRVRELLAHDAAPQAEARVRDFDALASRLGNEPSTSGGSELSRVGPYRLVERIGEGGMGAIWRARRDDSEFVQDVAVKLIKRGMDSDAIVQRFRRERQLLAQIQHPGVARLLDGGSTTDDRPYLVMERIEGEPIDRYCAANQLDLDARLTLFTQVCEAVAAAHDLGIVHRDLKPENILVTAAGEPKLLNFGIAKVVGGDDTSARLTRTGERVLTPRYAAPEQVQGHAASPSTDVYALGVMLYELLTERSPYSAAAHANNRDLESAILEEPAPRPSTATTGSKRARLRGDLDVIVLTALHKIVSQRYANASTLAEDLQRHRDAQPIRARPESTGYRLRTFIRRHRALVGTTVAVVLALTVGLAAALFSAADSERRRVDAEWNNYAAQLTILATQLKAGRSPAFPESPSHIVGWEYHHVQSRADNKRRVLLREPYANHLAMDDTGNRLAAMVGGAVVLLDPDTGEVTRRVPTRTRINDVALSPDGRYLAWAHETGVAICDLTDDTVRHDIALADAVSAIVFHSDNARIFARRAHGIVSTHNIQSGATLMMARIPGPKGGGSGMAIDPTGKHVAVGGHDGRAHVFLVADGQLLRSVELNGEPRSIGSVAFSSDGGLLAIASTDGLARLFSATTGRPDSAPIRHGQYTHQIGFLPGRREFLMTGTAVRIFDLNTGAMRNLTGAVRTISSFVVHPTKPRIYAAFRPGVIAEWDSNTQQLPRHHLSSHGTRTVALHPAGQHYAAAVDRRPGENPATVLVRRLEDQAEIANLEVPGNHLVARYSPSGGFLVAASMTGIRVFDTADYVLRHHIMTPVHQAHFSPRGHLLAARLDAEESLGLYDTTTWQLERKVPTQFERISGYTWLPDGRIAFAGSRDGEQHITIFDLVTEASQPFCTTPATRPTLVASPGGRWLAICDRAGRAPRLEVRDLNSSELVFSRKARGEVLAATFTPDGTRLIAAGNSPRIYETSGWRLTLDPHEGLRRITWLEMARDGSVMLSSDAGGDVRVWRTAK